MGIILLRSSITKQLLVLCSVAAILLVVLPSPANSFAPSSSHRIHRNPSLIVTPSGSKSLASSIPSTECLLQPNDSLNSGNGQRRPKPTQVHAATESKLFQPSTDPIEKMNSIKAAITKFGMMSYVASMCVALPVTLFPAAALYRTKIISRQKKEQMSLRIGQFCSRWLMRVFPFAKVQVVREKDAEASEPEPSIWVCNHTSMLDVFLLLSVDKKLRGKKKRPLKIVYWKDLENNPVTKLLFTMCGFIAVEMEANGNGNANSYKKSTFKKLLKDIKQAFEEGFDIGILPEGQLNPTPELGLQPVFPGAFTLAKMSRRPIRMMGLHGLHRLWHPDESIGMTVTGRKVCVRSYPQGQRFNSSDEFIESFQQVVGYFGAKGKDLPNWSEWLRFGDNDDGNRGKTGPNKNKNNGMGSEIKIAR